MDVYYLNGQEIIAMHMQVMYETDDLGEAGIDPENGKAKFEYMLDRPKTVSYGVEQFPTILHKACCYLHSIARGHVFKNGNKRTGSHVFLTFLDIHERKLNMTKSDFEDYVVSVAEYDRYKSNDCIGLIADDLSDYVVPLDDYDINEFDFE